ncbi:TPA: hypothetical protein HA243_06670 [Candidatus Micrarchaeota archaeon]|nr:hypothetical protein [Candidatus Micrarchaeota archaeon]
MPSARSLLFMLLLLGSIFAAQTPLEKFLNDSFEPDQEVKAEMLEAAASTGFAYRSDIS